MEGVHFFRYFNGYWLCLDLVFRQVAKSYPHLVESFLKVVAIYTQIP